ncbi:universal stress protein [Peribacillus muralis]|uniref:universal stress protein n=1 Tax=Peribacillus muralis TaxID=264697 RepID=UPI00070F4D29|nr:universal stress protein [Peribacillus muralis]MCK1991841.1 universal stress protein [Peribacillus muralis]MCK2012399.1 universal stress protein [Peribacillus muralis]
MNSIDYKKILVAVDGSEEAEWALKKAIYLAKLSDATLVLAHIVDTRNFPTIEAYDMTLRDSSDAFANELLEKYKAEAVASGIANVQTEVSYGSPKVQIPKDVAKKHSIDLIVCGATGLNAVERFLIGSVSEGIVRNSSCDVIIVRTNTDK